MRLTKQQVEDRIKTNVLDRGITDLCPYTLLNGTDHTDKGRDKLREILIALAQEGKVVGKVTVVCNRYDRHVIWEGDVRRFPGHPLPNCRVCGAEDPVAKHLGSDIEEWIRNDHVTETFDLEPAWVGQLRADRVFEGVERLVATHFPEDHEVMRGLVAQGCYTSVRGCLEAHYREMTSLNRDIHETPPDPF